MQFFSLSVDATIYRNSNFVADIFSIGLTVQSAQQQQQYKVHLSFYTTWDI